MSWKSGDFCGLYVWCRWLFTDLCDWLVGIPILSTRSLESCPSSFSWPKVEPINLLLFLGIVLLQSLGATHCSIFIVPWATCFCQAFVLWLMLLNKLWIKDLVGGTSCNVVMVHNYSQCLVASRAIIHSNAIACRNHCVSMSWVVRSMCKPQVWKASSQMPDGIGSLVQSFQ